MPIKIPDTLPAYAELAKENIFVMDEGRAFRQDIRPLRIAILNLMPTKKSTELQLLRMLSNTPLQIDITLVIPASHESTHTSHEYLERFYKRFTEIEDECFDGLIVTGAPLEKIEYEQVDYWEELCRIFDWAETHVFSTLYICWASLAGLYHHYGIEKVQFPEKRSGIYVYKNLEPTEPLMRGLDDVFRMPQSRYATVRREEIDAIDDLKIVADSDDGDLGIIISNKGRIFITGHLEYDRSTLNDEYNRDVGKGLGPKEPENYYDEGTPVLTWRSYATLIFTNWVNYYVYQCTPFDINEVRTTKENMI
ncbi:MAG: homoserine O-succinyltransferase [Candidatus Methanomethylophilaceae archaeon]|nr:homoserine O-succinyltransferase [Candidatus Methanomethylophilaceae archaeon]